MSHPKRGTFSFVEGLKIPEVKTLVELARKSANDLEHVVNVLLNEGSEECEALAERLFDENV